MIALAVECGCAYILTMLSVIAYLKHFLNKYVRCTYIFLTYKQQYKSPELDRRLVWAEISHRETADRIL